MVCWSSRWVEAALVLCLCGLLYDASLGSCDWLLDMIWPHHFGAVTAICMMFCSWLGVCSLAGDWMLLAFNCFLVTHFGYYGAWGVFFASYDLGCFMLVMFFFSLPSGCWCFLGCFLVFGRASILGFLVADYALPWFRLFMMCFLSSGVLFPIYVYAFSICRLLPWFAAGLIRLASLGYGSQQFGWGSLPTQFCGARLVSWWWCVAVLSWLLGKGIHLGEALFPIIWSPCMLLCRTCCFDLWIAGLLIRWVCQLLLTFSSWQACCWFMCGCSYWLDIPVIDAGWDPFGWGSLPKACCWFMCGGSYK
jgi:hypothetical protein